ncbi:unnamed protein product [Orchesella dallaii]|uniref:Uncharacterized protein n=1 Tax=Orchesella dallaii TaxID=48710 RepID=A0ABP1RJH9_9HEXA
MAFGKCLKSAFSPFLMCLHPELADEQQWSLLASEIHEKPNQSLVSCLKNTDIIKQTVLEDSTRLKELMAICGDGKISKLQKNAFLSVKFWELWAELRKVCQEEQTRVSINTIVSNENINNMEALIQKSVHKQFEKGTPL